jgi:SAM-dependent methyltransferase
MIKQLVRKIFPESLRKALNTVIYELGFAYATFRSAGSIKDLSKQKNLRLHLGCGPDIRDGWVNIDLTKPQKQATATYIQYDLRRGLPLAENTCQYIYSSHFFEHLVYRHGVALMKDCYHALQPGGIFRIALPHFGRLFEAYVQKDVAYFDLVDIFKWYPDVEPGTETILDWVRFGVYDVGGGAGHKCLYDPEKTIRLLKHLGYKTVSEVEFQEGMDLSVPIRRKYTFYIEAVK